MKAVVLFFATFFVGACVTLPVTYTRFLSRKNEARQGWNLRPIVVAAVDIEAGGTITMETISQRSIPEQFVTADFVAPDSASYVVKRKTALPLAAGDPLVWSLFADVSAAAALEDCTRAVKPRGAEVPQPERAAAARQDAKAWAWPKAP